MHADGPSEELVDALLATSRALVGVAARSLAGLGDVTLPQHRALVLIGGRPTTTVSDLADALDIHPTTATRLCDRLVRKELVTRRESDHDRRRTELRLAAKGRRLVQQVMTRRRAALARVVEAMPPEQLDEMARALTAFADAAGDVGSAPDLLGWPAPS